MQKNDVKNRFTPPPWWDAGCISGNPIFADLEQFFNIGKLSPGPDIAWLNQFAHTSEVKFVDNEALSADGRYYEAYIYATGQVPTRNENWHDFFGGLIWCLFPQTKKLLNQLHMEEISKHGAKQRSKLRNKLTLFDECGVVICLEPAMQQHAEMLRTHQWQQTFITQRSNWWQGVRPVIFGHAIYEMATAPFLGLTAKCLFLSVPAGFSHWPLTDAYSFIDQKLQQQIANCQLLLDNQQLTPLPLLGVPGWWAENQYNDFYQNTAYFRAFRPRKTSND
ncbi:DUF3025 domain-containing protein [Arsukibacterium indicum]|uniref:DUF3025 domain-containing protein n=1 Tax=Arsukibacterium indicum TaxID=2848612 RepID=A0ABS6MI47_9GAMM|nr:DUF3025 domain-containing protein [Arsukibacterium indicum]MBV2128472.1 DUF3025 domain-containing protein [Arsukibacterium indicum]